MSGVRAANRVVATVLALLLLAAAVIGIVEVVLAALGRQPWLLPHATVAADLHSRLWTDGLVRACAAVVAVLGLVLLVLGLRRGSPSGIDLHSDTDGVSMTVTRKSLQRYLAGVAAAQTGASSASATAGRGRVTVRAVTAQRDPNDLQTRIWDAVTTRVDALHPVKALKTAVSVHRREA